MPEFLIKEGLPPQNIIKTGSPLPEVLFHYQEKILASDIIDRMGLKKNEYFLVSCHREENVEDPKEFEKFIELLRRLADQYSLPVIVSTHPRTQKKLNNLVFEPIKHVNFSKPYHSRTIVNCN